MLPEPVRGGSIDTLRPFLNLRADTDFVLAIAWLLASLQPTGPYPVLVLSGEAGSAKSTAVQTLRAIIDPNAAPLPGLPRDERDLFIGANSKHIVSYDNLSGLRNSLSDSLCRLATGGSFETRKLYSDADEFQINVVRPIVLAGIDDFVLRGDLVDRALFLLLAPIPDEARKTEYELRAAFQEAHPVILGALLAAVSYGLRELPNTRLDRMPRMADFALWATACEGALWPVGTFMRAYNANRAKANDTVIEADLVAAAVRNLMERRETWAGTATELQTALLKCQTPGTEGDRYWPRNPRALSGRLRRAAPNLRQVGIHISLDHREGHRRDRKIIIKVGAFASASSSSTAGADIDSPGNDLGAEPVRTQNGHADAKAPSADD